MRRFGMFVLLLLSLGINAGILGTLAVQHFRSQPAPPTSPTSPISSTSEDTRPGGRAGAPPEMGRLVERLRLGGDDRARFLEIQRRFFETTRTARGHLEDLRVELRQQLAAPAPDRARIDALLQEISAETSAIEHALVANILDSREILDGDQERMFLRFVAERMRPRRLAGGMRPGLQRRGEGDGEAWRELPARAPEPR